MRTTTFCHSDKYILPRTNRLVLHWKPAIQSQLFATSAMPFLVWSVTWSDVSKKRSLFIFFLFTDHDWISQTVTFPNLSGRPFGTHRPVWGPWPEDLIQFNYMFTLFSFWILSIFIKSVIFSPVYIWNLLWEIFTSFTFFRSVRCNFGKLVVALTFHQVDTSCAGGGRPCERLLYKATSTRNLI